VRPIVVRAAFIVFIASFCTLVIELVAGRVLAPYVGVSLYTWTSIIGVVLAGISAGAWAGGWIADRRPEASTLGWLLIASGIAALLIGPATTLLAADDGVLTAWGIAMTLLQRVVVLSFLLFFLPAFFLGMISPVAVRLAVRDLESAGRTVGRLYALSTLGSIAGTFFTGFYLVATFGTRATLTGTGVALIVTALLFGGLFGRRSKAAVVTILAAAALYALVSTPALAPPDQEYPLEVRATGTVHFEESEYYTIQVDRSVRPDTGAPVNALHLDHLVHSYADLEDPSYLEYGYLEIFNQVIDQRASTKPHLRLQFVGGGGYTLPRLVETTHPVAEIDVVEIDPAVTRVARRYFGVPRDTTIRTANEDARWFSMRDGAPYDAIFIDAFNDLSVPYHLTTREYTLDLRRRMTPDGVLAANVIDDFENGRFLASYARTLQSIFGAGNVAVIVEAEGDQTSGRSTFVVLASQDLGTLLAPIGAASEEVRVIAGADLAAYIAERKGIVLTDDYAPVDNMLAPLFAERFVDEVSE
jgi:predicted membrane-bound spermidine synthase